MAAAYPPGWTRDLWRSERRGYLAGPVAYLRGRRHARRVGRMASDE